ncbi:hypothetical protein K402DRAFT_420078 [Aulographum hederae CBS 113979]|uniref:Uncharacterized protein n=1 Tax=Aulographum hederae CBS 113979 TaxID=1176131 RepID=A0A6G1H3T4_9PEZI|nr:hypothetical protein K402DRAFT_420078 [Aulographum hederae CBS 113979]
MSAPLPLLLVSKASLCSSRVTASSSPIRLQLTQYSTSSIRRQQQQQQGPSQQQTQNKIASLNRAPTPRPRSPNSSPLKVWPFILIFVTGTGLFYGIIKQREGVATVPKNAPTQLSGFSPPSGRVD